MLVMCAAGGRSIIAANLLTAEGYNPINISDGLVVIIKILVGKT